MDDPVMHKPFCEYNCDYPCSHCVGKAREAALKTQPVNPLVDGDDDDVPWMGYTSDGHRPTGQYSMPRFTQDGYEMSPTTHSGTTVSYTPPPFVELKRNQIIEPKEIDLVGPEGLKKKHIVIL